MRDAESARDLAFGLESFSDIGKLALTGKAASKASPRRMPFLLLVAGTAAAALVLAGITGFQPVAAVPPT